MGAKLASMKYGSQSLNKIHASMHDSCRFLYNVVAKSIIFFSFSVFSRVKNAYAYNTAILVLTNFMHLKFINSEFDLKNNKNRHFTSSLPFPRSHDIQISPVKVLLNYIKLLLYRYITQNYNMMYFNRTMLYNVLFETGKQ